MKRTFATVLIVLTTCVVLLLPASAQLGNRKNFVDTANGSTKITNGPIVERLKSDSAVIAWSTSGKSASQVKYGLKKDRLNKSEDAPPDGKGLMHRIQLKNLEPSTTYFFQVSSHTENSSAQDKSKILSFTTPALGAEARHNEIPR